MSRAKQKTWPLLRQGSVDVFNPVPMFTDQRGDWVDLRIATTFSVVGAIPRMGKTYFLREIALVGALDPRTEEYIFELKGTGDLSCTKLFAHYYSDSDEEEDIVQHLVVMRKLFNERRRRAKVIRSLPNEECPRSEVTTELASRRELRLHPILVEVDECQVWFEHPIKEIRDEFIRIVVTGVDDHSRFCVIATVVPRATGRAVCLAFAEALRRYGVPDEVLTDNGKQFTDRFGKGGEVLFDRICRDNAITHRLTQPSSPTTTGKVERFQCATRRAAAFPV